MQEDFGVNEYSKQNYPTKYNLSSNSDRCLHSSNSNVRPAKSPNNGSDISLQPMPKKAKQKERPWSNNLRI